MTLRNLVPSLSRKRVPVRYGYDDPFSLLQQDINSLFDGLFKDFEPDLFGGTAHAFNPGIEVSESDKEITISAELPGMDEKDITVSVSDDKLTLEGEKKEERESTEKDYVVKERSYGSFKRVIPLYPDIEAEKIKAHFKKGVLKIRIPKTVAAAKAKKKIIVNAD